ncbi:MAG: PASTA domain-containing protein [Propionibacteriales bacterium]|nr:PASTA domain-containing protein [Propionibacteriales bacterium]
MPDATGQNLQVAQDALQAATNDPYFISFSEDATSADRAQTLDSGWVVCSQDPAAGTAVSLDDDVTFFVVRVSEECP